MYPVSCNSPRPLLTQNWPRLGKSRWPRLPTWVGDSLHATLALRVSQSPWLINVTCQNSLPYWSKIELCSSTFQPDNININPGHRGGQNVIKPDSHIAIATAPMSFLEFLPVILGLLLHQVYKANEPKILTYRGLAFIVLYPLLSATLRLSSNRSVISLTSISVDYIICYVSCLASITTYRLSPFHRLSAFPGPWYLQLSKFINTTLYSMGRQHELFRRLHKQYGPIVRVGPNELSICHVSAVKAVLGTDGLSKGNCKYISFPSNIDLS